MKQWICDSSWLTSFLDRTLTLQKEKELISHLEGCPECTRKLNHLAADSSEWKDARTFLSGPKVVLDHGPIEQADCLPVDNNDELPFTVRQTLSMIDPSDDPRFVGRIGGYEVSGIVGNGAMGVVVKAFDRTLDRVVALKIMNPTLAACGTARHRFEREAKAAAGVLHPNVISIHGVSANCDLPFLVMPLVSGDSLQQRINRKGPLPLIDCLRVGSQVAAGLAAAHQKGVIHRDIKPSNIMLDAGVETALITDFGLARTIDDATMTRSGAITGTPEYMSPEQARGDSVDCSSDVFSLGSVLYTMCTGKAPFQAKTSFGVLRKITDENPKPIRDSNPDIPGWLCDLVERMHSKSASQRPSSTEIQELLEGCLAHVYQPDRIPLPKEFSKLQVSGARYSFYPVFTGVTLAMSVFIIAIFSSLFSLGSILPNESSPAEKSHNSVNEPTVHKTLKINFPQKDQVGTLKVDINRGFIEVASHDQSEVIIEILTPPGFENSKTKHSKIFAPKYDLDVDKKKNLIDLDTYNQDYVLNLRIKVPRSTNLDLDTYVDGHIKVKNVTGSMKARTEHCNIHLSGITGSASAYSRNGNMKVSFEKLFVGSTMDFETYNGDIDLVLPGNVAATTAVSSGTGSYRCDFKSSLWNEKKSRNKLFPKIKSKHQEYNFRTINGGGLPIRIESERGQIQIRKSN